VAFPQVCSSHGGEGGCGADRKIDRGEASLVIKNLGTFCRRNWCRAAKESENEPGDLTTPSRKRKKASKKALEPHEQFSGAFSLASAFASGRFRRGALLTQKSQKIRMWRPSFGEFARKPGGLGGRLGKGGLSTTTE